MFKVDACIKVVALIKITTVCTESTVIRRCRKHVSKLNHVFLDQKSNPLTDNSFNK